jgi:WD40 repeat protein
LQARRAQAQSERSREGLSVVGLVVAVGAFVCHSISWSRSQWESSLAIWDPATLKLRAVLPGNGHNLNAVAVAPDGRWLATGSIDGIVHIWDTTGWQLRTMMRVDGEISSCAWLGGALAVTSILGLFMFGFSTATAIPVTPELRSRCRRRERNQ